MELKKRNNLVRILAKGGVLTPQYLLEILQVARKAENTHIHLGSRQDIVFKIPATVSAEALADLSSLKIDHIVPNGTTPNHQNIVSSYVSADLVPAVPWLNAGNFLKIIDQFTSPRLLRINIVDANQNLIPLFYGNLNFVSSMERNYWFLFLRFSPDFALTRWPYLVHGDEIALLSSCIEAEFVQHGPATADWLAEAVSAKKTFRFKPIETDLKVMPTLQSDYEGFGRMHANNKYWLGLYWRNNQYSISFLKEFCRLCMQTGISRISLTTWKSILIKDIEQNDLVKWYELLGSYGITVRHSALELNWHLPLLNPSALRLKRFLVSRLDQTDVSVHDLSFGITNGKEMPFCTILIRQKPLLPFGLLNQYDVLYARNFNPHTCEYITEMANCPKHRLPQAIAALTRRYYASLNIAPVPKPLAPKSQPVLLTEYRCGSCLTVYKKEFGDPLRKVERGESFHALPSDYLCPVCDAPKNLFVSCSFPVLT